LEVNPKFLAALELFFAGMTEKNYLGMHWWVIYKIFWELLEVGSK